MELMLAGAICIGIGTLLGAALRPSGAEKRAEAEKQVANYHNGKLGHRIYLQRLQIRRLKQDIIALKAAAGVVAAKGAPIKAQPRPQLPH